MSVHWTMFYTCMIYQQMHTFKYVQAHIILQQRVSATTYCDIVRVSNNTNSINIQISVQNCMIRPLDVIFNFSVALLMAVKYQIMLCLCTSNKQHKTPYFNALSQQQICCVYTRPTNNIKHPIWMHCNSNISCCVYARPTKKHKTPYFNALSQQQIMLCLCTPNKQHKNTLLDAL
jgi:hypothetical protein